MTHASYTDFLFLDRIPNGRPCRSGRRVAAAKCTSTHERWASAEGWQLVRLYLWDRFQKRPVLFVLLIFIDGRRPGF